MKTKLLKKLRKKYVIIYDHKKQDWIVLNRKEAFYAIKPSGDYTYPELLYALRYGSKAVQQRRFFKSMNSILKSLTEVNLLFHTQIK